MVRMVFQDVLIPLGIGFLFFILTTISQSYFLLTSGYFETMLNPEKANGAMFGRYLLFIFLLLFAVLLMGIFIDNFILHRYRSRFVGDLPSDWNRDLKESTSTYLRYFLKTILMILLTYAVMFAMIILLIIAGILFSMINGSQVIVAISMVVLMIAFFFVVIPFFYGMMILVGPMVVNGEQKPIYQSFIVIKKNLMETIFLVIAHLVLYFIVMIPLSIMNMPYNPLKMTSPDPKAMIESIQQIYYKPTYYVVTLLMFFVISFLYVIFRNAGWHLWHNYHQKDSSESI